MMSKTSGNRQSVARRVATMGVLMLALVLIGISSLMAVVAEDRSRDRIVLWVGDKAESVADSIDAFDSTAQLMAIRSYKPFRRKFAEAFELDAEAGHLKSWGMLLNGDTSEVDAFSMSNGGVATIFMRTGDDFLRITTSLKKENGERAVGTKLDRNHPAYKQMMEGGTYTGRATLFGKQYMTHYEAVKDAGGQVVGILFIGFDITEFQASLEALVAETTFFKNGAVSIIDPRKSDEDAVFVVHPTAAGKKVLEVYPKAAGMLAQMRAADKVWVDDSTPLIHAEMTKPWSIKRQAKAGGWWVVAEVSDDEAMATHWATIYAFWGMLGVATLILGAGIYWLVRREVSRPLQELTQVVTTVSSGDLTRAFHTERKDEIGALVNEVEEMRVRYVGMMSDLRRAGDSINLASTEIAMGNQDLSGRTEQAASNLEETAASMEQLTATVRQSADAARQANQLATSAAETAQRGGSVVSQVVSTMSEINHSSQKISDIIGVIDGIAFQTNILALNAAVEAARAGEQGRGFAVVAAEVRSLAQRSAEAAKEIKGLIGTSVEKVENGSRLVDEAGSTMTEIVGAVQRVTDIIGEITAAAGEQSEGIGQVNQAVSQLDQMTQQNAALVEQSAAAAESLKDQARRLGEVIRFFQIDGMADAGHASHSAPAFAKPAAAKPVASKPAVSTSAVKAVAKPATRAPVLPAKASAPKPATTAVVTSSKSNDDGDWESF